MVNPHIVKLSARDRFDHQEPLVTEISAHRAAKDCCGRLLFASYEHCHGDMAVMTAIMDPSEVARYLKHVGIEHEAPSRAPPRYTEESFDFGQEYYSDEPVITLDN